MFSHNLVLRDGFRRISSRDHAHFRFGRQGAPKIFFRSRFSQQPFDQSPKFFQCRVPPDRGDIPALTPTEAGTRLGVGPSERKPLSI